MVGVFIQYDGGWWVAITGNLYGRIKREGQASRLFGMYQKSMFGWVMVLVVMLLLCLIMTYESGGSPVPQGLKRARASKGQMRRSFRQDLKLDPCATLAGTNSWCQLEHGGREFRKLSTAQRHPSRPSIAVLTQSSLSPVFESCSDPVATHIHHQLLVTPRPSWYAYLSLFVPLHRGLPVSLRIYCARLSLYHAACEPSLDGYVERWSSGNEQQECGSTLRHCP